MQSHIRCVQKLLVKSLLSVASVVLNDGLLIVKSSGWTSGGLTAYRLSSGEFLGCLWLSYFAQVLGNFVRTVNSPPVPHLANMLTS